MKACIVLFLCALLAETTLASLPDRLPSCAVDCFEKSLPVTACSSQNVTCLCGDVSFMDSTAACIATACTPKDTLTSVNITYAACGIPPRDDSKILIAIPASFGSLAILLVIIRVIIRQSNGSSFGWDDGWVVAAMVLACPLNFLMYPIAAYGMGKDIWAVPFNGITSVLKYLYIAEVFYMASELFTQLSILAFYCRIFPSQKFRQAVHVLMGLVVCFGIANTTSIIFQCVPVSYFWESWTGEATGKCINIKVFSWIRAALEILIDVSIISLPIPLLIKLQMSWRKKIQILMMFGVGFLITLVSILRLQSLIQFSASTNVTYDDTAAIYWSVLECDIAIICACMPATRLLLKRLVPSCFGDTKDYEQNVSSDLAIHTPSDRNAGVIRSVTFTPYRIKQSQSDVELVSVPKA